MDQEVIREIKKLIESPRKVTIITHVNPDGDALGSSLALYNLLIQDGHSVSVITPDNYPFFLKWMPACDEIIVHRKNPVKVSEKLSEAEIIFCLDFNDIRRMENVAADYNKSNAVKILMDHHPDPAMFTDYIISVTETSSASELIYDLMVELNKKHLLNKEIAECLYVGIVTDTGSFSFSCNYEKTYLVIAELFKHGIDGEHIHRLVYDTYSEDRLRLLGYCLSEKLKVFPGYNAAYISLTKKELKKFNFHNGDTEGVVNFALSIDGIILAALFMERENKIKVSLRSKGDISVNDIARKYYSGGGHHNAAGGDSNKNMAVTLAEFEKALPDIMKK